MPFDRVELHFAEATLYQEYEPKGENKILPFNSTTLQREEEDDGKVKEPERPPKIRRTTRPNGKVVYEFWRLEEGDEEDGKPDLLNLTQQPKDVHVAKEPVKEAPEYMNDVVKNIQEELVEIDQNNREEGEKLVNVNKGLPE